MAFPAEQVEAVSLAGTVLELETTQSSASAELKQGDAISLRVACPVIVEGVELIAAGTATVGVITRIEPSQILLHIDNVAVSVKPVDSEHNADTDKEIAAAALMFPAASLAVALFARRREHAVVRLGQRFQAVVCESAAALPQNK